MKIKLWVDDIRTPPDETWTWVGSAMLAMFCFGRFEVTIASLDHDLGDGPNGYDLVKTLDKIEVWPTESICIHTSNPVGRQNMFNYINDKSPFIMNENAKYYPNGYIYWDSRRK